MDHLLKELLGLNLVESNKKVAVSSLWSLAIQRFKEVSNDCSTFLTL